MDKHYLTPLFAPQSILVFAGSTDSDEGHTQQQESSAPDAADASWASECGSIPTMAKAGRRARH